MTCATFYVQGWRQTVFTVHLELGVFHLAGGLCKLISYGNIDNSLTIVFIDLSIINFCIANRIL